MTSPSTDILLPDPEPSWERSDRIDRVSLHELEQRIGPISSEVHVLSGGQANLNVRVNGDRVLRIYRRDSGSLAKECALLGRGWTTFQVPKLLKRGDDFLLLEYVPHERLTDTEESGQWVGAALAEIHGTSFDRPGFLAADLTVHEPFSDFVAAVTDHVERLSYPPAFSGAVLHMLQILQQTRLGLESRSTRSVLLHGDFKPANLNCSLEKRLLVLDWEFAYAGPALMDIGQLLRWDPSPEFRRGFAEAYRQSGGQLDADWERWAETFDLTNLLGLLAKAEPGSRRARDLLAKLARHPSMPLQQ